MTKNTKDILLIALLGAVFFLPGLGGVHLFDWDEINFAEAAREMLVTNNYLQVQIDYQPFWEKPPLFLWFQAMSMQLFGIGEYAARFPNAICGIITLITLFFIGKKHFSRSFGWFWVLAYCGAILPHLYFKSGIIDPWFNLFIFLSVYQLIGGFKENGKTNYVRLLLSGTFAGLAMMTKGPAAMLIIGLVLFVNWIYERFRFFITIPQFLMWLLTALVVTGIWFSVETWHNGIWFTQEFITYQWRLFSTPDAGHKGFWGYHFVVLLLGCFPTSFVALPSFIKSNLSPYQGVFKRMMLLLFWVVLILFSIVQSKIVHYSSLCYYPLTFLAALTLWNVKNGQLAFPKWLKTAFLAMGVLLSSIVIAIPFLGKNIQVLKLLFEKDKFALANLDAAVTWTGLESIAGFVLLLTCIFAFIFYNNYNQSRSIKAFLKGTLTLFLGTALFVQCTLVFYINNIEGYSQNAAIEFYKDLQGKDVYVRTEGFKSYAHLFYSRKQPNGHPQQNDMNWLLNSKDLDKDVYFVTKVTRRQFLDGQPNVVLIGKKNGFVFYKREKVIK